MRPAPILFVLAAIVPQAALADTLDRYEGAREGLQQNLNAFLVSRIPDLIGVIPPADWQDADREIAICALDSIRAAEGDAGVEAHVAFFEAGAALPMTTYAEMVAVLTRPVTGAALAASMQCGEMDRAFLIAQESGMNAILADPENQRLLTAAP